MGRPPLPPSPRRRRLRPLQGRHPAARRPQRPRAQPVRGKTHRTTRLHGPHALTGGDLGESFAIILVRTGPYGAWLRHPAIQRARDSGHAAPQAPRARDELAPLWLCRAFQGSQTFHKGTREILLNLAFSVQNSHVRASSSLLLYLAQVNPAGTEFTRLSSTVLERKPLAARYLSDSFKTVMWQF